jgi:hypothetical protein
MDWREAFKEKSWGEGIAVDLGIFEKQGISRVVFDGELVVRDVVDVVSSWHLFEGPGVCHFSKFIFEVVPFWECQGCGEGGCCCRLLLDAEVLEDGSGCGIVGG